jgi:predicted house-cleaning NTP pyrophosphatase (Maf/HAM1 superfamily)
MQITIPENLSTRLRQLATRRRQPVETIIADRLFTALDDELDNLPTDEQAELRALHHLSDDALRVIAAEQMTPANQALLKQLMARNSKGELDQAEQETLAALVERGDQLILRKAEAAATLVHRGYAGAPDELMTPHA